MGTQQPLFQVAQRATLRRTQIEIALLEHAERGGKIFDSVEVDVATSAGVVGAPLGQLCLKADSIRDAVIMALDAQSLTVAGGLTWGVGGEGVFVSVDVTPKPKPTRKPRGPNKPKTPPVAPAATGG